MICYSVPIAAGRPRKLTTLKTNIEELNTLWQIQQVFVPSLTMQSSAPSHSGTRAWNQLKAQEDSLGQYAFDPQAVAAPMLVSSCSSTTCHGHVYSNTNILPQTRALFANIDLTPFLCLAGHW